MSKLVHVNKIEFTSAALLVPMRMASATSCRFSSAVAFTEINIEDLVDVIIEDEYENNQRVYTTTASFRTCSKSVVLGRKLAFRLTSVDGKRFMIGSRTRPYPIIRVKDPFPGRPTDDTLKTVTVTWKALTPMLLIEE